MNKEQFTEQFEKATSVPIDKDRKLNIVRQSYEKMSDYNNIPGSYNLLIVMEELAELQQEVSKFLRNKGDHLSLVEELADVALAIDYVQDICNITDEELTKAINVKLERQDLRTKQKKESL